MLGKRISLIIGSFFIFALLSSSILSASSDFYVAAALEQNSQGPVTLFSIRLLPPAVANIDEGKTASYKVQVARGNEAGQFSVALSTASSTAALDKLRTFSPSYIMNFEEGERIKNATLIVQTARSLDPGTYKFQIKAAAASPTAIDQGATETAALVISDSNSKKVQSQSEQTGNVRIDKNNNQKQAQDNTSPVAEPEKTIMTPNHAPVAKAGQDKIVNAGARVVLDGRTSIDPEKDTLTYSWEQTSPSQPQVSLANSDAAVASFAAVGTDNKNNKNGITEFTFKLTVRDDRAGLASDTVKVLVRDDTTVNEVEPTQNQNQNQNNDNQGKETGQQQQQQQQQQPEDNPISNDGSPVDSNQNRPPFAEAVQDVFTDEGKPVSIILKAIDSDANDKISFSIASNPVHGTIAGINENTGQLTYVPGPNFSGKDAFKFKAIDSKGAESNEATVAVLVGSTESPSSSTSTTSTDTTSTLPQNASSSSTTSDISNADVLKQRLELIQSKIKQTRGEKIANQYIVVLKSDSSASEAQTMAKDAQGKHGAKLVQLYQRALKGFTVSVPNQQALEAILNDSKVAYAEPDVKVRTFSQTLPTGVDRVDGDLSSAASGDGKGDNINADIAVLDTGIDISHPDLNVYKDVTFVPDTTSGNDDNGHGTMVAGVAAAKDNNMGVVGMAPGAKLWAIKVLDKTGTGSLSTVIQGIDYVTQHASEIDVADMSFGCENCNSQSLNTAISNAISAGVNMVAAAGNGGKDASTFSPGNHPNVIAVSAISDSDGKCGSQGDSTSGGADDSLALFSNYGPAIDVAAPGVQIYSTSKNGGYSVLSGTSMAAPHVAGAAALYVSENANASPSQVLTALKSHSSTASNDCDTKGHGYFTNDKDASKEPLLYVGTVSTTVPGSPGTQANNNTSTNTTNTNPEPPQLPSSSTNATNTSNTTTTTPPPVVGNVTNDLANGTALGNQTSGNQTSGNQTSGNQTSGNQTSGNQTSGNQTSGNQTSGNQTFSATAGDDWFFLRQFGAGILTDPHGVDVDPATGKVYVADTGNDRIAVFLPDGSLDTSIDTDGFFGSFGASGPEDITIAPTGSGIGVYVTDPDNNNIDAYTLTGTLLQHNTVTYVPHGIGFGFGFGQIYVTDPVNELVTQYTFGSPEGTLAPRGSFGYAGFDLPTDVACCLEPPVGGIPQKVYVTDPGPSAGNAIFVFDAGPPNQQWLNCCGGGPAIYGIDVIPGTGLAGRMIFSDSGTGTAGVSGVFSYYPDGGFAAQIDLGQGSTDGKVLNPRGIAVDPDPTTDSVYVADTGNNRIQVFVNTPPDATPPIVTATYPSPDFADISITPCICVTFSELMDESTINNSTVSVAEPDSNAEPAQVSYDPVNNIVSLNPLAPLSFSTTYFVVVSGGDTGVKDAAGNPLENTHVWSFTTMAEPPASTDPHPFAGRWGSTGTGNGQFSGPTFPAIDSSGNIYVAEGGNNRIQKFTSSGVFITKWGSAGTGDGELSQPEGLGFDSDDNIYVTEQSNGRIQKFTSSGVFITKWGSGGAGDGEFSGPSGLAVDSSDNIYIADFGNHRIQKFDSSGQFITKWGISGFGDGEFSFPAGIAVDSADNVYVSEYGNNRIQKFTSDGAFITKWGSQGSADGQLELPVALAVDSADNIYVSERGNSRIQKFTSSGVFITKWGSFGAGDGQFNEPFGLVIDPSTGKVYIAESANDRVQVFDSTPDTTPPTVTATDPTPSQTDISITPCVCITFSELMDESTINTNTITVTGPGEQSVAGQVSYDEVSRIVSFNPIAPLAFSSGYSARVSGSEGGVADLAGNDLAADHTWSFTTMDQPPTSTDPHPFIARWGSQGSGNGQFSGNSGGIAADSAGNIYVTDHTDDNVQKFKSDGTFVTKWGTTGTGNSQFDAPFGIAADSADNIYVVDHDNNRVQKFDSDGVFITKWGSFGQTNGLFSIPQDVAVDSADNVYVVDGGSQRVQKFDSDGGFISTFGTSGTGDGQFTLPSGIAIDSADNIYVTDRTADRIQKFDSAGAFVTKWGSTGTDDSKFNMPYFLDIDSSDNVYVADIENNRVQVFTSAGVFINKFGTSGSADGQFSAPLDVAIGPANDNAYILDTLNNRVQVFASQTTGKHPTSLSISVPEVVVDGTTFTVAGHLTDVSNPGSPAELVGAEITFTGNGASNLQTVSTQGVSFVSSGAGTSMSISSCPGCPSDLHDGTVGNKVLRIPEGGEIILPENTFNVKMTFDDMGSVNQFSLDLILAGETTLHYTDLVGGGYLEKTSPNAAIEKIVVVSSPVEYVGISSLSTSDFHGFPDLQQEITFENFDPTPSLVSPFVVNGGSYYSVGSAPANTTVPSTFEIEAVFAGNDTHEAVTSGSVSYVTSERSGQGASGDESVFVGDVGTTFNNPPEFANLCANLATGAGDTDADGICDAWEVGTTLTPAGQAIGTGNVALIKCPQKAGAVFIDVATGTSTADCDNLTTSYDLCHLDAYADVWDRPALTDYSANQKICPHKGHKDMFVEIDYIDDKHKPNPSAIRDVIMAFGNAPVSNTNVDDFNRAGGITLHVIVNEKVTLAAGKAENTPISVWTDSNGIVGDDFDSIKHGSPTILTDGHFGTSTERQDPKKLDMKHYVYRYGLFGHTWGNTCGPSGMGEILGNDFIVTLGCGFGVDGSGHSVGTRAEQAGTFMHELGHTLNLGHGGPAEDLAVGRTNYEMNCKPNYLSVMQYSRQFPGLLPSGTTTDKWEYNRDAATGNPLPAKVGTSTWPGTALDYSRTALIDLNENAGLKEATGLQSSPAQKFIYGYKDAAGATRAAIGTTGPSVDWNKNGVVSPDTTPVTGDLNSHGITGCPTSASQLETAKGKSDWASVKLKFLGDADALDGAGPDSAVSQVSRTPEITGEILEQMEQQAEASGITDPQDTTAPQTQIITAIDGAGNSVPEGTTTSSNNITFTFSGTDDVGVSDFECSLDSPQFVSCNSPLIVQSLEDGPHALTVRAQDAAGNFDATPASRSWKVDTTLPAAPAITSPITGTTTANNKPQISGTAEASSTVLIFDGATQIGTTTAASTGAGAWSFTPTTALTEGVHSITAKARDAAGNTSPASTAISITINTAVPPPPSITPPATGTTNNNKPTLSGTAQLSSTVLIFDGATQIGTTTAASTGTGAWSFTPTTALSEGSHTFTAKARNTAGITSPASNAVIVTIDTIRPTVTSTIPANGATGVVVGSKVSATFNEKINPTTVTTSTFTVKDGTSSIGGTFSFSTDGKTVTFTPSSALKFSTTYTAKVTTGVKDMAGNSLALDKTWTFGTQAPSVVFNGVLQPINQDGSSTYNLGKNIPVKLQLKNGAGQFITNAKLTFTAQRLTTTITGTSQETETSSSFTAGSLFKYDTSSNQYKYNWKTNNLQKGTWAIKIYQDYATTNQKLLQGPQPPTQSGETVRLGLK